MYEDIERRTDLPERLRELVSRYKEEERAVLECANRLARDFDAAAQDDLDDAAYRYRGARRALERALG